MIENENILINQEVKEALDNNKPVVALESTLISHGLPYPKNIEVANLSISSVKKAGSIPATIGIIGGKIIIGLTNNQIEQLGSLKNVQKVSNHNFLFSIQNKENAATTVASTISIASMFNIKFFSTGGIGGVHLNSDKTFDISNDLISLSKNNNFVVCSGAKSILDINKTYEFLETLGISRIGYKTDFMPGFWYSETDKKVDKNFNKIEDINSYLKLKESLNQKKSVLIFNKVPKDKGLNKNKVEEWINKSIIKSIDKKIIGKDITPFLIKEMNNLSKNKTLEANISLIIENASLAGKLAKQYYS